MSCALPNWEHPDPKTRAALHYARTLTLDDGRDREVYAELKKFTVTRRSSSCRRSSVSPPAVIAWPELEHRTPRRRVVGPGEGNVDPWKRGTAIAA